MHAQQCVQWSGTNRPFGFTPPIAQIDMFDTATTPFLCAFSFPLTGGRIEFAGDVSGGVLPDPIPNSEVKPSYADGTARETLWESRSSPALLRTNRAPVQQELYRGSSRWRIACASAEVTPDRASATLAVQASPWRADGPPPALVVLFGCQGPPQLTVRRRHRGRAPGHRPARHRRHLRAPRRRLRGIVSL